MNPRPQTVVPTLLEGGLLFLLAFPPLALGMTALWTVAIFRVTSVLLLTLWLTHAVLTRVPRSWRMPWWATMVLVYLGINLASLVVSVNLDDSQEEIANLVAYLAIFIVAQQTLRTPRHAFRLCGVQIGLALLLSLYSVFQHYGLEVLVWDRPTSELGRSFATFGNANRLAGYLIMIAPLFLAVLFTTAPRHIKIGAAIGLLLIYAGLVFTYSRGGWLGFLASLGCFGLGLVIKVRRQLRVTRRHLIVIVVLVAVVMGITVAQRGTRLLNVSTSAVGDESIGWRLAMWRGALKMIEASPWLGTGIGTYRTAILAVESAELQQLLAFRKLTAMQTHNDYLQIASEIGLPGLMVLVILLGVMFVQMERLSRSHPHPSVQSLILGVAAGLMAIVVHGLVDSNLHLIPHATLLWIDLGLVLGVSRPHPGAEEAVTGERRRTRSLFTDQGGQWERQSKRSLRGTYRPSRFRLWVSGGVGILCLGLMPFEGAPYLADISARRGNAAREAGRLDESITAFKTALRFKPFSALLHTALGSVYEAQYRRTHEAESLRAAIAEHEQTIACHPSFAPYYANYGQLLLTYRDQLTAQDLDRALVVLTKGISLNPYYWSIHNNLGVLSYLRHSYQDAEREYRRALQLQPNSPDVYNNLGTLYRAMGRLADATTAFQRAMTLQPNWVEVRINLGNVYQTQGKLELAIQQFQRAVILDRTNGVAWYNLGQTAYRLRQWEDAEHAFKSLIQRNPDNVEAWNSLGAVYYTTQRYDQAIQCFDRVLRHAPRHVGAYQNLGNCYVMKGRLDLAATCYETALRLDPHNQRLAEGLRQIHVKKLTTRGRSSF